MKINIYAVGKLKASPLLELCGEYLKRFHWAVSIKEIQPTRNASAQQEAELILKELSPSSFVICLDERGESLTSPQFASKISNWNQHSPSQGISFVIGGADGLDESIRKRSKVLLSFGKQTWPHMFVRVMLLEQIYRAQQIISGHPYHRQ